MALGVAGADIAGPRQVRQHLRKAHRQLPFQPAWLLRLLLSLAGPPCAAASASLPSASAPASPATSIAVASPRDVLDKMAIHRPRNRVSCRRLARSALQTRKRPAKTSPRSEAGRHRSSPHSRHSLPSTSRRSIRPQASSERRTRPWLCKARASAARSSSGLPYLAAEWGRIASTRTSSKPRRTARSARPSGQARSRQPRWNNS